MDFLLCYKVSIAPGANDVNKNQLDNIVYHMNGVDRKFRVKTSDSIVSSNMIDFVLEPFSADKRKDVLFVLAKTKKTILDTTTTFEELGLKQGQIIEVYLTVR